MTRPSPDSAASGRTSLWTIINAIWSLTADFHRVIALLIVIGIGAAMAESLGITVLISLVFMLMNGNDGTESLMAMPNWFRHGLGDHLSLPVVVCVLLCMIILKVGLTLAERMTGSRVTNAISETLRRRLFNQLLDVSLNDVKEHDRGELLSVLSYESFSVALGYNGLVRMGINIATILIFGTILLALSWQLALIAAVGGLIHTSLMRLFSRQSHHLGVEEANTLEELTNLSWTSLQAMRSIRCFGIQAPSKTRYADLSARLTRFKLQSENIGHRVSVISEAVTLAILVIVMLASSRLGVAFQSVLACTALLYRLQPHVREFDHLRLSLYEWYATIRRTQNLLRTDDKTYLPEGHLPYQTMRNAITFDKVAYTYPSMNTPCIQNLSFSIPVGQTTAILGPSGSGKSTVVNMLLRLMQPDSGDIRIDNVNLFDIRSDVWLSTIAIAGQDVELIEGTVRENILMMREGFSEADVRRAATIAGIADFADTLPNGYDEWIGDEALKISGGQRQRLGIARALLGRPEILILDEATNALDDETEKEVLANIRKACAGSTIIFISHRPINLEQIDHRLSLPELLGVQRVSVAVA